MMRIVLALVAGIVLGEHIAGLRLWWLCGGMMVGLVLMMLTLRMKRGDGPFRISLWVTFISMGWALVLARQPYDPLPQMESVSRTQLSVHLTDTPVATSKCYKVSACIDSVAHQPSRGKIMLFIRQDSAAARLGYGDYLTLDVRLQRPSDSVGSDGFDYRKYLYRHGITWQCFVASDEWSHLPQQPHPTLLTQAHRWQQKWVDQVRHMRLSPSQQGIVEALVLGWRADLDDTTQQQFRQAGIVHLLCVSGMHVGLLAMIVGGMLFFLGQLRWQRVLKRGIQIVAIWGFVLLSGMGTATVRAGIMFSLMVVGGMMERKPNTLNNLATSALLILIANPLSLFDVGFQMSYAAVLGIALWYGPLRQMLPIPVVGVAWMGVGKLWSWLCLSTSAQMAVLPLSLYYFHQYPTYFLIANLTIVPFAGVLLASILAMLLSGGGDALVGLVSVELRGMDAVTRWIAELPYASISNIYFDLPMALMLGTAWMLLGGLARRRGLWALSAALLCLILMVLHYYGVLLAK